MANRQAGIIKVLLILLLIIVSVVITALLVDDDKAANPRPTPSTDNSQPTTSPDRVKGQGSPNADTAPSLTGTGPGSDNSILSQPSP